MERETSAWFMSERAFAAELGVHPSTLVRLAQVGGLPVEPVQVGQRRVYPVEAVRRLAAIEVNHDGR